MKTIIITAIIAGTIGFIGGNAFWYLASPLWIDRVVSEGLVQTAQNQVLAAGSFSGVDSVHQGAGAVNVIKTGDETIVRFTEFEVTNGPDLYVWLVKNDGLENSGDVSSSETLELGLLKGNIGDQNYVLPTGVDISEYGSVAIWCKQFGFLFASADLTAN